MKQFKTDSGEQTTNIGWRLGKVLKNGDIICLNGGLGAGKTAFTKGIAIAMGIGGYITSPTFTIVNEYDGTPPLYHFDVYRISSPDEMFEIGFDEYIDGSGVVVIEWADIIKSILPKEYINVEIQKDRTQGVDIRIITIDFFGEKYSSVEECFSKIDEVDRKSTRLNSSH